MRLFRFLVAAPVAALALPLTARAQDRYVAPTSETITSEVEQGMGSVPTQLVWVHNGSTVPIHVYGVMLRDCENVRGECGPRPVNIAVAPDRRELVMRVEREDAHRSMHFHYGFSWRPDSGAVSALHILAKAGDPTAVRQLAAHQAAIAEANAGGGQTVMLGPNDLAGLGARVASLRFEPDSVVVHVGQAFVMHQVHLIAVDSAGGLLGRVRGYRWRIPPGPLAVQPPDTILALRVGRTAAEFRLAAPAPALTVSLPIIVVPDSTQ